MEDKSWLSFEKSGLVSDYLNYCKSSVGKYAEYKAENQGRSVEENGADVYFDRNDSKYDAGGRVR